MIFRNLRFKVLGFGLGLEAQVLAAAAIRSRHTFSAELRQSSGLYDSFNLHWHILAVSKIAWLSTAGQEIGSRTRESLPTFLQDQNNIWNRVLAAGFWF